MLGSIDRGHVVRLLEGLSQGDGSALMEEVARLDEQAPDYGALLDELMGALQRIAVIQVVGEAASSEEQEELSRLAPVLSREDVQLYYQIALQGRRDLDVCRDFRSAVEMILLRMLAFRPVSGDESSVARPKREGAPARPMQAAPERGTRAPERSRASPEPAVAQDRGHDRRAVDRRVRVVRAPQALDLTLHRRGSLF